MKYKIFDIPDAKFDSSSVQGNNKNQILIVVKSEDLALNSEFLQKILAAVNLDFREDCLILKCSEDSQFSLNEIILEHQVRNILNFGISHQTLGTQFPITNHHIFHLEELSMLTTKTLGEISANQELKKKLWDSLKEIFINDK